MEQELSCRIILESPTAGVDFSLQKGKGNDYQTVQKQRSAGKNLSFAFTLKVKTDKDATLVFLGPFAQGTPQDRFIYIDIGKCAGQMETHWERRLKIPLKGITSEMIQKFLLDPGLVIEASVAGVGKDGGPNCATVKPFNGWKLAAISPHFK